MEEEHAAYPYFIRSSIRLYAMVQQRHTSQADAETESLARTPTTHSRARLRPLPSQNFTIDQYAIYDPESADWVFTNFD